MTQDEIVTTSRSAVGWSEAPALIVLLGDGRRQWATVQGAHTFGRGQTHLTDGLSNASMLMHLAAATLGLGSQHTTIHIEGPFKQILGVPDLLSLVLIMPIGYPAVPSKDGVRRPLADMVHHDAYDPAKYTCPTNRSCTVLGLAARQDDSLYRNSYVGDEEPPPRSATED